MKKLLLIDGDQFVFKATAAMEREVRWDDQNHVLYSNEEECWTVLVQMFDRIFERFETRDCALCFSAPPNFRLEIEPTYKGGRSPRKPLCYAALRERLEGLYRCVAMPGLEADDVMGILATKPGIKGQRVIVSQDKDMRSIPTTVWNGKETYNISQAQADYWHLYQTLMGDTSDGYKGCPGVGPKKAEAILTLPKAQDATNEEGRNKSRWYEVVMAYKKAELTEEDALKQARLARILRWEDWDGDNKRPILWTPKN
jgi:DNA polymerase I